ncbi:MAG: hypothetical protein V1895_03890 [Parcubacteria group bacterium]
MSTPESEANKSHEAEVAKVERAETPDKFVQDVKMVHHQLKEVANAERMAGDTSPESAAVLRINAKEWLRQAENMTRLLGNEAAAKGFGETFEHGAGMASRREAVVQARENGFPQMAKYLETFNADQRKLAETELQRAGLERIGTVPSETEEGGKTEYWYKRGK